ncbi:MAG: shikimate dehydrogenase [Nitrososphaeraceae archaeon]
MTGLNKIGHAMSSKFKTYCIIGDPIEHSLSPLMQNSAFKELKLNCTYIAFRVPKHDLKDSIASLKSTGISGFNVTLPHKVEIMKYLDNLDNTAINAGAVNTVKNENNELVGYNTDIYGFIHPLHQRHIDFTGLRVLIIGAGGAAKAIVAALSSENYLDKLVVVNRSFQNCISLSKHCSSLGIDCICKPLDEINSIAINSDLIINSSSLGLNQEKSLIDSSSIKTSSIVYDIVYKPMVTNLLKNAKKANATLIYGYEMLLAQGTKAFTIWTGLEAPEQIMKNSLLGIFGEPK